MKTASILKDLEFNPDKPTVTLLMETESTKELRIAMRKDQVMKEHKTPFPIAVEVFKGEVNFGVKGEVYHFKQGDLLALEGNVPHDLTALSDTVIRLTLSKKDALSRVEGVSEL